MDEETGAEVPRPTGPATGRRRLAYAGAAAALLGLGAGLGWDWWRSRSAENSAEEIFWNQRFEALDNSVIETRSLRGQPLLVNFWATWCPPCVEEMPLIDGFYLQHKSKGHQVLGIAIDKREAVEVFAGRVRIHYPLVLANQNGTILTRQLGNLAGGLPFSIFFRPDGNLARRKMGKLLASDLDAWGSRSS